MSAAVYAAATNAHCKYAASATLWRVAQPVAPRAPLHTQQRLVKLRPARAPRAISCSAHRAMRAIEAPLSALAEALWPSVPGAAAAAAAAGDLGLSAYYRLSGSYCPGVVDQAMHAIDRYVHGGNKTSLILFLSLLNFRLGTLLLCGATCITAQFPFVYAFPQLPVARRELIFQRWQVSRLGELQKAAKAIKSIVLSSIFSYHSFSDDGNGRGSAANGSAAAANPPDAVSNGAGDASANAKSGAMPPAAAALPQNPFWETIGYVPGPAAPRLPPHPNQAAAEAALAAAVIDLAAPPTGALPAAAASETPGSSSSGNGAADADSAIDGRGADRAVTSRQRLLRAWLQSRGLACSESLQASEIAASHGADCVVEADAVVIGSGAGGGVAAAMLAASGLRQVAANSHSRFSYLDTDCLRSPAIASRGTCTGLMH